MAGPVLGPCVAWVSGADVQACCPAAADLSPSDGLLDTAAVAASQVLYEVSGRRFPGVCEKIVRPCATSGCGMSALGVGIIPGWGGGGYGYSTDPFGPWAWTDTGIGAAGRICGCSPLSEVLLDYPVVAITQVKVDGVVVDPATYRVDDYIRLVRLWDTSTTPPAARFWPSCQNLGVGDDQPGSFSVTYEWGSAPPLAGVMAAQQLACQLVQACHGAACSLPVGATKITKQGVTIDRGLLASWVVNSRMGSGWVTGLVAVDAFLTAVNPHRLQSRPSVWSPDVVKRPRRVGT